MKTINSHLDKLRQQITKKITRKRGKSKNRKEGKVNVMNIKGDVHVGDRIDVKDTVMNRSIIGGSEAKEPESEEGKEWDK